MLTAAFLHSPDSLLHIMLNMYTLWIFGQALEPLLGRARFLALYLISAVGGSVGYLLLNPLLVPGQRLAGVVGASGAIFGLFGAMLLVQRHRGGETRQLWVLIAINGVIGFLDPPDRLAGPPRRPHHRCAVRCGGGVHSARTAAGPAPGRRPGCRVCPAGLVELVRVSAG